MSLKIHWHRLRQALGILELAQSYFVEQFRQRLSQFFYGEETIRRLVCIAKTVDRLYLLIIQMSSIRSQTSDFFYFGHKSLMPEMLDDDLFF